MAVNKTAINAVNKEFLEKLRRLLDEIPKTLTVAQLEWALSEAELSIGCELTCIRKKHQRQGRIPGGGTH